MPPLDPPRLPPGYAFEADLAVRPGVRVVRARRRAGDGEELPVVLRLERADDAGETEAELALCAAVEHPGLARVLDFGELAPTPDGPSEPWTPVRWLAREWIEGVDLLRWSAGRTAEEKGAAVCRLTPALEHLHRRGFVHADLKPENVLVADDGRVVLCDFGLARRAGSREAGVSGSLFAIAPELLIGGAATPAADLFALGALLHRLLAPERASARAFYARFPARSFFEAAGTSPEELPPWARDLVAALTAREPSRRPRSAAAVGTRLAGRLGLADPLGAPQEERLEWPVEEGREAWMRALFADLAERDPRDPFVWVRTGAAEAPAALHARLRLSSALGGASGSGIDLGRELAGLRDGLELDRWARERARDLVGRAFVLLGGGDWQERGLAALSRALRQEEARDPARGSSLVVVSARPAPADPLAWEERRVPAVDAASVRAFLATRLPAEPAERLALLAERLSEAAEGSATLLDELLGEAHGAGLLARADGRLALRPGPLPIVARRALEADRLAEAERSVATALWLCGGECAAQELAAVAGLARADFAGALVALAERHVALERSAPEPGELVARARTRIVPARALLPAAHGRRADWLERTGGEASLARAHAWAAAPSPERLASLVDALAEERRRGCPERVLACLERLGSWSEAGDEPAPELVLERALAWCDLGRHERAKELLEALDARVEGPSHRARVALALARVAGRRHLGEEAREHLRRALALDPTAEGEVAVGELRLLHAAGRDEEVLAAARALEARPAWRELYERDRSFVASLAAMSLFRLGRPDEARERTAGLADEARASDDPGREAALRINLATIERRAGSLPRAREELARAAALYERAGYVAGLAHARATLGGLLRETGEFQEAEAMLGLALEARERLGDAEDVAATRGMLGLLAFERGHAREAIETLAAAAARLRGAERRRFAPLLEARADEMRARIGAPLETPTAEEVAPDPRVLASRARTAALAGEPERARELARRAAELASSLELGHVRAEALALCGELDPEAEAPSFAEGELDALVAADLELRRLLARKGEAFDVAAAASLARRLEAQGRDDRAARAWYALSARAGEPGDFAARAERAFSACAAGLSEAEAKALRASLLGLPDPWPGDFVLRPGPDPDEELEMEVVSVLDINKRLLHQEDLESLLGEIVEHAMSLIGAERGFLVLEESGRLRYDLARDSARGDIARPELEVSGSVVAEALAENRILRISNAVDDPLLGHTTSVVALELRSILCVPFDVRPGLRGALYLDHRLRSGAFDERSERLVSLFATQAALAIQQVQRLDEIRRLNRELERRIALKESDLRAAQRALRGAGRTVPASGLIGDSEAMRAVHRFLERAAPSSMPVLVIGDSGTGKELAARSLHDLSPRKSRPFVSESCAAIPASLVEAELFGSVRGAYTGAEHDRPGLFERAQGGTLFLDEIGELPLELQAKLLRVLETGEVRRLGSSQTTPVDFRLVAATNRDLEQEVAAGRFRSDLYYRLDGLRLTMPTLAERPEDVEPLARHFLRLQEAESGVPRQLSRAVLTRLCRRAWPGNVRELRNEVARLCVLCEGDLDDPSLVREPAAGAAGAPRGGVVPLAELERVAIQEALAHTGGDKRKAAELLGISRATIYKRLKDWGEEEDGAPEG